MGSIHPNKNPFTYCGEENVGMSTEWHGLPNFSTPLLFEEGKKLRTSNFVRIFTGSIGTKLTKGHEKFPEKWPWA